MKGFLVFCLFLICFSRIAVGKIDDATVSETVAGEDMVHYYIVPVSVDPDRGSMTECPVEKDFSRIVPGFDRSYPMNYIIGIVIEPAAFDVTVCRVRSGNECHCGYYTVFFAKDDAMPIVNILSDDFRRRVNVVPLMQIAA